VAHASSLPDVHVLILGGTGEARKLAAILDQEPGITHVSSLAGRVSQPALPVGEVRVGGFGGPAGLVDYLVDNKVDAVIDATHPFAETITRNAAQACAIVRCRLLVLQRPGWAEHADDRWLRVPDIAAAAVAVRTHPASTVFLTTGRRDLAVFAEDDTHSFVIRTVDPPDARTPARSTLLLDRGPYTYAGETAILTEHGVGLLVTKDSGGEMTAAKLDAARELGIPVVVVDRPALPDGIDRVATVQAAMIWLTNLRDNGGA
jgi:precorrin-6A/cobalt-precorrin-6A reductase